MNLQLVYTYNIKKYKEIIATCSYSYQYTEYKYVAMPNRNYTTICTYIKSNKM